MTEFAERVFKDNPILDDYSKIETYLYEYKPEARDIAGTDDEAHVGFMAQQLKELPSTEGAIIEDTDGYLKVNCDQLSMTNTAAIAELSKRVAELENIVKEKHIKNGSICKVVV